jgi:hypothetical protein
VAQRHEVPWPQPADTIDDRLRDPASAGGDAPQVEAGVNIKDSKHLSREEASFPASALCSLARACRRQWLGVLAVPLRYREPDEAPE